MLNLMSIVKLLRSFRYAFDGFGSAIRTEANVRWHLIATAIAIGFGVFFRINSGEWIAITLCIGLVISAELFNTSLERLADRVTKENDELIKQSKDISAAAITVLALMSVVVGAIVFLPKIWMVAFG